MSEKPIFTPDERLEPLALVSKCRSLETENERIRARTEKAEARLMEWENREAAVCPEDVGFDEYIGTLEARAKELEGQLEKAQADRHKYEALYGEAREALCSCNLTGEAKGELHSYTCQWCEDHPRGAEVPPFVRRMFESDARVKELETLYKASQGALRETMAEHTASEKAHEEVAARNLAEFRELQRQLDQAGAARSEKAEAELRQEKKFSLDLMRRISILDTSEPWADADDTKFLEEFNPWDALKRLKARAEEVGVASVTMRELLFLYRRSHDKAARRSEHRGPGCNCAICRDATLALTGRSGEPVLEELKQLRFIRDFLVAAEDEPFELETVKYLRQRALAACEVNNDGRRSV